MSYFGQANYHAGDPGFFDTIGKIGKGIIKYGAAAAGVAVKRTPVGAIAGVAAGMLGSGLGAKLGSMALTGPGTPIPGIKGVVQRFLPGGETGYAPRRRRMQFTNQKALNRAIRRVSGFGNLVKRSKKSIAKANRALNPSTGSRKAPARKR